MASDAFEGKRLRAVVFDLDGTLLDTLADLAAATNHALREGGMPERSIDEVRAFVGNGVGRLIARAVPAGSSDETVQLTLARFKRYYVDHCEEQTHLYDGIATMLTRLHAAGLNLAIVSNKLQAGVTELHHHYFKDTVSVAIGEHEGLRRKPCPDMVEAALTQLGVSKDEAVYVGDSDVDIATARAAGLPCVSVLWGFRDEAFLREHGATRFSHHPDHLTTLLLSWHDMSR